MAVHSKQASVTVLVQYCSKLTYHPSLGTNRVVYYTIIVVCYMIPVVAQDENLAIILLALLEGFDSSLHVHTLYMWNLFTEEIFNHLSSWNMSF